MELAFRDNWIKAPNAIRTVSFLHLSSLCVSFVLSDWPSHMMGGHDHTGIPNSSYSFWLEREKGLWLASLHHTPIPDQNATDYKI